MTPGEQNIWKTDLLTEVSNSLTNNLLCQTEIRQELSKNKFSSSPILHLE